MVYFIDVFRVASNMTGDVWTQVRLVTAAAARRKMVKILISVMISIVVGFISIIEMLSPADKRGKLT